VALIAAIETSQTFNLDYATEVGSSVSFFTI